MRAGRQAGVKRDDLGLLSELLEAINASRSEQNARFDLVLPAGNDNLDRVVARYDLKKGCHHIFDWNIIPSDQSDNYLEVWAERGNNFVAAAISPEIFADSFSKCVDSIFLSSFLYSGDLVEKKSL